MSATLDRLPPELVVRTLGYLPIVDYLNLKLAGSRYITGLVRLATSRISRAEYCAELSKGDAERGHLPAGRLRSALCITIERNQTALVNLYLRKYQQLAEKQWKTLPKDRNFAGKENQVFRAALHWAAYYGSEPVARFLLESDLIDVNARCSSRRVVTPLHVAAMYGHAGIVNLLISHGAEIDVFDRQGRTVVELALDAGHNHVAALLQSKGAAENMEDVLRKHEDDWPKLTRGVFKPYAHHPPLKEGTLPQLSRKGRLLTYFLVYNCVIQELNPVTQWSHRSLQKKIMYDSIQYGLRDGVVSLLERTYIFETDRAPLATCHKDRCGASALHLATSMGNHAIIKILLDHGAPLALEGSECWLSFNTPVSCAIRRGDEQAVRLFIDSGFPINTKNSRGQTWLHMAAAMGRSKIVDLLLQHGAAVDELTMDQETPLHVVFRVWKREDTEDRETCGIVCALLHRGANVNARSKDGLTPLHKAIEVGKIGAVRQLLAHGADVSATNHLGCTPLHHTSSSDIIDALLGAGADVNARDKEGNTLLHLLFSTLHQTAQESDIEKTFDLLMHHGADINARNESGSTVLHEALQAKSPLVTKILSSGADPNATGRNGPPPLGIAGHIGHRTAFEELLNHGADIHWKDARGRNLFHYVSSDFYSVRYMEPYKLLLERGLSPDAPDNNGDTPLFLAVKRGKLYPVIFLLEAGADANGKDKAGLTPIQHFSFHTYQPWTSIMEQLVSHGADINVKDSSGDTTLHRALKSINGKRIVGALMRNGVDPNVRDANGHTPLQLAIWKGWDDEVVRSLLRGGADPNVRHGNKQWTLLHSIVFQPDSCDGHRLQALLDYGGRADAEDIDKRTPMDIARETGNEYYQRILEKASA